MSYLSANSVLLKDFGRHVHEVSERLKQASLAEAQRQGRPVKYLGSPQVSKETIARKTATDDGVSQGLIGVLTSVEPCQTFEVYRNRDAKRLELVPRRRKCLFLYHYWIHPRWGFMHARIQTWFPFAIQLCLNGREWLARQMKAAGLKFVRADNCFPWVEDWARAQRLLDRQLRVNWANLLDEVARPLNPAHAVLFRRYPNAYYWTTYQSEWATDVVFHRAESLRHLYPRLLHHALTRLGSRDVMRYLGRRLTMEGTIPKRFHGEVVSDLREREEGIRIKHAVNGNSVKLYDKAFTSVGSVLRTSEPAARLSAEDTVRSYKSLAEVERAFGCLKGIDLLVRSIRHRTEGRVPAHIFLCLLAYYVEWHLRRAWAPLLFEDEERREERKRRDPILPAEPTASAKAKKQSHETREGLPVHSFSTLLGELASRARVTYEFKSGELKLTCQQVPEPTPLQARAYELIRTFPVTGN